jgi:hypothetical protein
MLSFLSTFGCSIFGLKDCKSPKPDFEALIALSEPSIDLKVTNNIAGLLLACINFSNSW